VTVLWLKSVTAPFVLVFFGCFVSFLVISGFLRLRARVIVYNLAFVFLSFAGFEVYLQIIAAIEARRATPSVQAIAPASVPSTIREGSYLDRFLTDDPELGYRIVPLERKVQSILRRADGSLIYDVEYSLDRHGMRKTEARGYPAVYFFGDSFTFGEGVADDETLPAAFSRISGRPSLNFAVPGYGPHQMLRQLETDWPGATTAEPPLIAVFTLLTGHIERAAGRSPWDTHGPHYEAVGDDAVYRGPFRSEAQGRPNTAEHPAVLRLAQRVLASWRTYQLIDARLQRSENSRHDTDRVRVAAILLKSRKLLRERFHCELVIVLWDTIPSNSKADAAWFAERLKEEQVPFMRISRALPELIEEKYYLSGDGHPRGEAYELVAKPLSSMINPLTH
jgi:hypothetical protein